MVFILWMNWKCWSGQKIEFSWNWNWKIRLHKDRRRYWTDSTITFRLNRQLGKEKKKKSVGEGWIKDADEWNTYSMDHKTPLKMTTNTPFNLVCLTEWVSNQLLFCHWIGQLSPFYFFSFIVSSFHLFASSKQSVKLTEKSKNTDTEPNCQNKDMSAENWNVSIFTSFCPPSKASPNIDFFRAHQAQLTVFLLDAFFLMLLKLPRFFVCIRWALNLCGIERWLEHNVAAASM